MNNNGTHQTAWMSLLVCSFVLTCNEIRLSHNEAQLHREYRVSVFWYQVYQARLLECLLSHKAWRAIQHTILKLCLVNFISKDTNLVFYLSVNKLFHSSYYQVWRIMDFCVDSMSLTTLLKSAISRWPDKGTCHKIGNVYQVNIQQCS